MTDAEIGAQVQADYNEHVEKLEHIERWLAASQLGIAEGATSQGVKDMNRNAKYHRDQIHALKKYMPKPFEPDLEKVQHAAKIVFTSYKDSGCPSIKAMDNLGEVLYGKSES